MPPARCAIQQDRVKRPKRKKQESEVMTSCRVSAPTPELRASRTPRCTAVTPQKRATIVRLTMSLRAMIRRLPSTTAHLSRTGMRKHAVKCAQLRVGCAVGSHVQDLGRSATPSLAVGRQAPTRAASNRAYAQFMMYSRDYAFSVRSTAQPTELFRCCQTVLLASFC